MGRLAPFLCLLALISLAAPQAVECFQQYRYADEFVERVEEVKLGNSTYFVLQTLRRGGKDLLICDEGGKLPRSDVLREVAFYHLLLHSNAKELADSFEGLAKYADWLAQEREKSTSPLENISTNARRVAQLLRDFGEESSGDKAAECYEALRGLRFELEGVEALGQTGESFLASIQSYEEAIDALLEQLELRVKSKAESWKLLLALAATLSLLLGIVGSVALLRRLRPWRPRA